MSQIVFTEHGMEWLLNQSLHNAEAADTVTYRWFSSDTTPTYSSAIESFTLIETLTIAEHDVLSSDWSTASSASGISTLHASEVTLDVEDSCTVRGYVVLDQSDLLLWAQKLDEPLVYSSIGGTLTFTPKVEMTTPLTP